MTNPKGPVLIEREEAAAIGPDAAPPVPDLAPVPEGRAMQTLAVLAARPRSRLGRFFWGAAAALVGFMASVATWRFVEGLLATHPVIGWIAAGLTALFVLAALLVAGVGIASRVVNVLMGGRPA